MKPKETGVHITAGGFEYDRMIIPMLSRYPVEKLIILHSRSSPYTHARDLSGVFLDKIRGVPLETEVVEVDIYDFDEVFLETLEQINRYAGSGKMVYINVSPVPKLATAAMMSAAFLSPHRERIEIFYASPERYLVPDMIEEVLKTDDHEKLKALGELFMERGMALGVEGYQQIPVFPIQEINERDRQILSVLKDRGGVDSIEELVEYVDGLTGEEVKRSSIQYRLDILVRKGLVDTHREDRRLKITLTRLGELYLSATGPGD